MLRNIARHGFFVTLLYSSFMEIEVKDDMILIDKPKGITSFDIIRKLRRIIGKRKMGHAGTLDPLASGLMIIGVDKGTKKLDQFLKLDKSYIADILFGQKTDTGDLEGKVIDENKNFELKEKDLEDALKNIEGLQKIQVPMYSAIKVNGRALYDYARSGEEVEAPVKEMRIDKATLLDLYPRENFYIGRVLFDVGSGTYIRALAEKIGESLEIPATLADLRRTKIGEYKLEDAQKLEN
jgi:tRNA pseudouridine55 synthase